jgi:hypothetical protein
MNNIIVIFLILAITRTQEHKNTRTQDVIVIEDEIVSPQTTLGILKILSVNYCVLSEVNPSLFFKKNHC